jgi:hypothetical protein
MGPVSGLFGRLTKHLANKRTATDVGVKESVTSWLKALETDLCYAGLQALVP